MSEIIKSNSQRCAFCSKKATEKITDHLNLFSKDNSLYLCEQHFNSFQVGTVFGQMEINAKIISILSNIDDDLNGESLKDRVYTLVPMGRYQVQNSPPTKSVSYSEFSPKYFYESLNKKVIGQEDAKKRVSLAVYEHVKSSFGKQESKDRHNILLLGASGSGKTFIINNVAKDLNVPFVVGDATSYSPTGFQGADAESCIHELWTTVEGDIESAERGVVFIDEIDKLATYNHVGTRSESFNQSTQSTMLKLIEGKRVKIPSSVTGDTGNPPPYISTSKILFCFGGAFNGLHKIVAKKMGKKEKTIGLRADSDYNEEFQKQLESYEILKSASQDILVESLIEYGLSAEFVGRIQNIVALAPLNKEELMKCLMEIDSSPVNKQQLLFAESGIHLKFDDDFLNNVVDKVEKMGTGTRALNTLVKKAVSYAAFEHLGYSGKKPKSITILQECLDDPQKYLIEY